MQSSVFLNYQMTLIASLILIQSNQGNIIHDYSLLAQLIWIEEIDFQFRKIQSLMEEQDVSVISDRVIVSHCRCHYPYVFQGWELIMETIHRNGLPGIMYDTTRCTYGACISMRVQLTCTIRICLLI